jgi:hypothetical protein
MRVSVKYDAYPVLLECEHRDGELTEPVQAADPCTVGVVGRIEVLHVGRDLGAEQGRIERTDPTHFRFPSLESLPQPLGSDSDRSDTANPRHRHTTIMLLCAEPDHTPLQM